MKRATALLPWLGVILLLVVWYLLIWSPRAEELTTVETSITDVQAQQTTTRSRIATLQAVREEAPQLAAQLAAVDALLPPDTALPSALRQLQQAADDSGATLVSVSPARPVPIEGADPQLYELPVNVEVRGSYFQIVDVLRRLEDPAISPRGTMWNSASLSIDEYPTLIAVLTGRMFAVLPAPPDADTGTTPPATDDGAPADDGVPADGGDGTGDDDEVDGGEVDGGEVDGGEVEGDLAADDVAAGGQDAS